MPPRLNASIPRVAPSPALIFRRALAQIESLEDLQAWAKNVDQLLLSLGPKVALPLIIARLKPKLEPELKKKHLKWKSVGPALYAFEDLKVCCTLSGSHALRAPQPHLPSLAGPL